MDKKYEPVYICWVETDFMGDRVVMRMTPHQRLMYRALCQAAMFCSSRPYLPDDDKELYLLADADSLDHWKENKEAVLAKFYLEQVDGKPMLAHRRIMHDWEEIIEFVEHRRAAGAKGGQARAKHMLDRAKQDAKQDGEQPAHQRKVKESKGKESKEDLSPPDGGPDLFLSQPEDKPDLDAALKSVWEHYLTATNKSPKLNEFTSIRKRKGLARLQECQAKTKGNLENSVKLMKLAIDKLAQSDFHMGRDSKTNGKTYNKWEDNVFRSYEQMEDWWQR